MEITRAVRWFGAEKPNRRLKSHVGDTPRVRERVLVSRAVLLNLAAS